jgi:hypothetical protein
MKLIPIAFRSLGAIDYEHRFAEHEHEHEQEQEQHEQCGIVGSSFVTLRIFSQTFVAPMGMLVQ